jgi:hypothetical protein
VFVVNFFFEFSFVPRVVTAKLLTVIFFDAELQLNIVVTTESVMDALTRSPTGARR